MKNLKTARPVAKLRQGRTDWYAFKNITEDSVDVLIYDEIGYWGVTAQDFVRELADLSTRNINLRLNSPGGDVFDGIAILNALRNHQATVNVTIEGLAASAASFIAMAGETVTMARNSELMIHEPHAVAVGLNAAEMRDLAERLDKVGDNIASIYAEKAGGTVEQWRAAMERETWYSAQEAVDAGLADAVQGSSSARSDNSWDLSIFNYSGREKAPAPARPSETAVESEFDAEEFARIMKEAFHSVE